MEKKRKKLFGVLNGSYSHGMCRTKFYVKWRNLYARCNSKDHPKYPYYGARGIMIEWSSFEEFRDDMYASYLEHVKKHGEKDTTIERTDVDGNYCKENCRWATQREQQNNTRKNVFVIHNGETKTVAQWSDLLNIPRPTMYTRISKGFSPFEKIPR